MGEKDSVRYTEKRIRDRHIYDKTIWIDFEYLKMPVPAGYDIYLKNRYGDYMTPQNVSNTHGGVIFDTEMDELVKEYKGESPVISFEDRIRIIRALKCVDKAIPQQTMNKLDVLEDIQYDVLFHGDDWKNTEMYNEIEEKLAEKNISCVYFPYTKSISTQSIKEKVKQG